MAIETLLPIASLISVLVLAALGFMFKRTPDVGDARSSISGAALVSSAVVEALIAAIDRLTGSHDKKVDVQTRQAIALERQADALEGMLKIEQDRDEHEQRRRDAEHENTARERDALRRMLDEQERAKR